MKSSFVLFLGLMLCSASSFASADGTSVVRYRISAIHVAKDGSKSPIMGVDVGFDELRSYPKPGNLTVQNDEKTDANGNATVVSGDYGGFVKRVQVCATLDGHWYNPVYYCAQVPAELAWASVDASSGSLPMVASDNWHSQLDNARYSCSALITQDGETGTVEIACEDQQ